jgi:hypothetical protein
VDHGAGTAADEVEGQAVGTDAVRVGAGARDDEDCWVTGADANRDWEGFVAWRYGYEELGWDLVGNVAGWQGRSAGRTA